MRIVAGKFRGRAIAAPEHDGLRPTSDRVRESVFNILAHGIADFELAGARVIDLFAGTGALGLEAMSRGAAIACSSKTTPTPARSSATNVEAFGLTGETRIFRRDATDLGPAAQKTATAWRFPRSALWQGPRRKSAQRPGWRQLAAARARLPCLKNARASRFPSSPD